MIVVDANILLYAYDRSSPHHDRSASWLETTFAGDQEVGLPLVTLLAFVRIATDPRVYQTPATVKRAIDLVASWLARPNVHMIDPTDQHWETLARLAQASRSRGSQVMDAHLAAMTLEHGASLATADRGFARFPGLRTFDPTSG